MATEKETMVIYASWVDALEDITDAEERWETFRAMTDYGMYRIEPNLDSMQPYQRMALRYTMPLIDSANKRYDKSCENGAKGGRKKSVNDEEVLKLKEQGFSNRKIAEMLDCSATTVNRIINCNENMLQQKLNETENKTELKQNLNVSVQQNLYVYDNDNDNVTANVNDNVTVSVNENESENEHENVNAGNNINCGNAPAVERTESVAIQNNRFSLSDLNNEFDSLINKINADNNPSFSGYQKFNDLVNRINSNISFTGDSTLNPINDSVGFVNNLTSNQTEEDIVVGSRKWEIREIMKNGGESLLLGNLQQPINNNKPSDYDTTIKVLLNNDDNTKLSFDDVPDSVINFFTTGNIYDFADNNQLNQTVIQFLKAQKVWDLWNLPISEQRSKENILNGQIVQFLTSYKFDSENAELIKDFKDLIYFITCEQFYSLDINHKHKIQLQKATFDFCIKILQCSNPDNCVQIEEFFTNKIYAICSNSGHYISNITQKIYWITKNYINRLNNTCLA